MPLDQSRYVKPAIGVLFLDLFYAYEHLPAHMRTTFMPGAQGGQKRMGPMELELPLIVNWRIGARD